MTSGDGTHEESLLFCCEGEQLVGVLARPDSAHDLAVVIVVGGPQYRVGSHRQFVHLARCLARNGFAATRFDYRGMGDSMGSQRSFETIGPDIRAAIDATVQRVPNIERVVLWGLCDGASAAMMYAPTDPRIAGLVLANPWARGEDTLAQAHLKHYYVQRLLSRGFWAKLLGGGLSVRRAARDLGSTISGATRRERPVDYRAEMLAAMNRFRGATLLILSKPDLTAQEFLLYANASDDGRRLLARESVTRVDLSDADHTFSAANAREQCERETVRWLLSVNDAKRVPTPGPCSR